MTVYIEQFSYLEPDCFLSSEQLETNLISIYEKFHLSVGRLELMSGIKRRGVYRDTPLPSQIATGAANQLNWDLISREDIGLFLYTGVCRDVLEPATSAMIHHNLKLSVHTEFYDLSNACLGFLNGMKLAEHYLKAHPGKKVLIVTGENSLPLIHHTEKFLLNSFHNHSLNRQDLKKYFANLTIGSIGIAMLLGTDESKAKYQLLENSLMTDTSANHLCRGDGNTNELMMNTDSEELMEKGIQLGKKNFELFKNKIDKYLSQTSQTSHSSQTGLDMVLTHQVGVAHKKMSLDSLDLNETASYFTFPEYGNTGSGAIILTLIKAHELGLIHNHNTVGLLGIGSGLSSLMMGVKRVS